MSDDIYSMTKVGFHNALREAKAQALEEAANDPSLRLAGHSGGISITRLRARAEELRQG